MKQYAPWEESSLGRSVAAVLAAAVTAWAAVTGLLYAVVVAIEATATNSGSNNGFPYTPPGRSVNTGTGLVIDTRGDILSRSKAIKLTATLAGEPTRSPTG